jgi:hypothetical protein
MRAQAAALLSLALTACATTKETPPAVAQRAEAPPAAVPTPQYIQLQGRSTGAYVQRPGHGRASCQPT